MIRVCSLSALPRGGAQRVDVPVGVLGMNHSRLFGRCRRQLPTAVMV